jgi:hypothetical protein
MAEAMKYRRMALTATTPSTREALLRLAIHFVARATDRKFAQEGGPVDGRAGAAI